MEYNQKRTLKFDEYDIVKGFMESDGPNIIDQIEDLNEKVEWTKKYIKFEIPSKVHYTWDKLDEEVYDETTYVEIMITLGYYPKTTFGEYIFVDIQELNLENGYFCIMERADDELLCKVENSIYYFLRGMFYQKFGK